MVLMTMIARVADGLPLAASMQEDQQVLQMKSNFQFSFHSVLHVLCLCSLIF